MLLLPSLLGLVYTLAHQQLTAALVFLVLCVIIIYKGLVRLAIPANSVVVRDGKVVFYIPERTVRNRFDFYSRSQTIIELPHYGLLDHPYKLEIVSPDTSGLTACRLTLTLGYIMDLAGWQRVYDLYISHHDRLSWMVNRELYRSSARLALPSGVPEEADREAYLRPIVAELDHGLEDLGLKIEEATCTFTAGPTLVRLVATEQESVEREEK
jgi:hypothetical protein